MDEIPEGLAIREWEPVGVLSVVSDRNGYAVTDLYRQAWVSKPFEPWGDVHTFSSGMIQTVCRIT